MMVNQSPVFNHSTRRSSLGSERDCLVHWCHGATGVAPVLMAAANTLTRRLKEIHPLTVVTHTHTDTLIAMDTIYRDIRPHTSHRIDMLITRLVRMETKIS